VLPGKEASCRKNETFRSKKNGVKKASEQNLTTTTNPKSSLQRGKNTKREKRFKKERGQGAKGRRGSWQPKKD